MGQQKADIGRRAAEQIAQRAWAESTSIEAQVLCVGAFRQQFYQWTQGRCAPNAVILAKMADAGYDVIYILTGRGVKDGM